LRFLILLLISFARAAFAQDATSPFTFRECQKEQTLFCSDKNSMSDIMFCLSAHESELSIECRQDIDRYVQLRQHAAARGGGALSSFGGLNAFGAPVPLISYEGRYSPGGSSPSFFENRGNISAPVHKTPTDTVSLSLAGGDLHLGYPVTLNSGTIVSTEWYRAEIGTQFFHRLPALKYVSFRASVGYAGDHPFENANDTTFSFNANYGFPGGSEKSFWLISIFFSNNSPLGDFVPIPGVSYLYKTENFTGLFGFPVTSIQWTPVYPWSFSLSIFGPTVQSEVAYGLIEKIQFFVGYALSMQSYLPADRTNSLYRLTFEEMRAGFGARHLFWQNLLTEVQVGSAFDRSMYIGDHILNDDGGKATLADDQYVSWSLKAKF
jgi:hypothetical protein